MLTLSVSILTPEVANIGRDGEVARESFFFHPLPPVPSARQLLPRVPTRPRTDFFTFWPVTFFFSEVGSVPTPRPRPADCGGPVAGGQEGGGNKKNDDGVWTLTT